MFRAYRLSWLRSLALPLVLIGCGQPPTPSSILSFNETAAVNLNKTNGGKADEHICGAVGQGHGFLVDRDHVAYEWHPIVGGPDSRIPTVGQPQYFASGSITKWHPPDKDFMFAHPFGLDYSMDITLDPAFLDLNWVPAGSGNYWPLHAEIEQGLFPYDYFGYGEPQAGDRVLLKGAWIMDCGHTDNYGQPTLTNNYGAEIHPPTFLAFARQHGSTTTSLAFANPYRVSQLYNTNASLANDFGNYNRFTDPNTKSFPGHLHDQVEFAVARMVAYVLSFGIGDYPAPMAADVLVEPTDFENVTWFVCAPSPRPAGATLKYTYRFTMRTGVGIQAIPHDDLGCVQFIAVSGGAYTPMAIPQSIVPWPWKQIEDAEGMDVQGKVFDAIADIGHTNFSVQQDPLMDLYLTLPDYALGPDGGGGGNYFQDQVRQDARLTKVTIHWGEWIDSIQIATDRDSPILPPTRHGGGGGDHAADFSLAEGEYITAISGRYGDYVDHFKIETNTGRSQTFGGTGGHTDFSFVAPTGSKIIGFVGRSGKYLDAIGVVIRRAADGADSPTGVVESADKQPFPFYGRARVYWEGGLAASLLDWARQLLGLESPTPTAIPTSTAMPTGTPTHTMTPLPPTTTVTPPSSPTVTTAAPPSPRLSATHSPAPTATHTPTPSPRLTATPRPHPFLTINPSPLDFSPAGPFVRTITVTDATSPSGTWGPITFSSLRITGNTADDFKITGDTCSRATLNLGQSCTITITFHASGQGQRTAILSIFDNAGDTWTVPLSGPGLIP